MRLAIAFLVLPLTGCEGALLRSPSNLHRALVGASEMNRGILVACIVLALLSVSCRGPKLQVDGVAIYEKNWTRALNDLTPRVAFDMDCDSEPRFTLITRTGSQATVVGIRACGRAAIYTREFSTYRDLITGNRSLGGWRFEPSRY